MTAVSESLAGYLRPLPREAISGRSPTSGVQRAYPKRDDPRSGMPERGEAAQHISNFRKVKRVGTWSRSFNGCGAMPARLLPIGDGP